VLVGTGSLWPTMASVHFLISVSFCKSKIGIGLQCTTMNSSANYYCKDILSIRKLPISSSASVCFFQIGEVGGLAIMHKRT